MKQYGMQEYSLSDRRQIAKLKRLSSPNRLSRVCRFRRQEGRGLPRPCTLPVGIPFESRVLPARLYFFPCAPARNRFALRRRSLPSKKEGTIARPRSEHLIFLSVGRSGRQLRDSRSYAMVLSDLRCCKTAFYRTGHCATIYGAGAVMRHRATILYRTSAAIFTR